MFSIWYHRLDMPRYTIYYIALQQDTSRMSNIESNNSQNGDLEDYNNISDGIFFDGNILMD